MADVDDDYDNVDVKLEQPALPAASASTSTATPAATPAAAAAGATAPVPAAAASPSPSPSPSPLSRLTPDQLRALELQQRQQFAALYAHEQQLQQHRQAAAALATRQRTTATHKRARNNDNVNDDNVNANDVDAADGDDAPDDAGNAAADAAAADDDDDDDNDDDDNDDDAYERPSGTQGIKRRRMFEADIKGLMYGFGDVRRPRSDTAGLIEDLAIDYIRELTHAALDLARARARPGAQNVTITPAVVSTAVRLDEKKSARCRELIEHQKIIEKERKATDPSNLRAAAEVADTT